MAAKSTIFKARFDTSAQAHGDIKIKNYIKPFMRSMLPFSFHALCIVISSLLYAYTFVMTTRVLGTLIDIFVSSIIASVINGENVVSFSEAKPTIINAILFIVANTLFSLIQGVFSASLSTKYSHNIRTKISEKFTRLPMTFIDSHFHNEFYNTFTDDTDALNQSLNLLLGNYLSSLFVVIGIFLELFRIDFLIASIMLLITIIGLVVVYITSYAENQRSIKQQSKSSKLYSDINEFYGGIKVIQHSGNNKEIVENMSEMSESLASSVKKARKAASVSSVATEAVTAITLIVVLIVGAFRIHADVITLGILITLVVYIRKLHQPLSQISAFSNLLKTIKMSLSSIFSMLTEKELFSNQNTKIAVADDLEFDNVSFSYTGTQNVLNDISFKIKSKGITAISGETGAGKSTIIKLILNFYSPNQGKIKMGGHDISDLEPVSYKKLFTIIPQNAQLFDCSIKENIAYGAENVTDEQIKEAAEKIGANRFIETLEHGYDTEYSACEGNLSSGQIQLILLTRAFLQKSKFIIFDESTSFIDADAEIKLNQLLKTLSEDCSIIIIAHRQTAISIADNIIKISNGEIIS